MMEELLLPIAQRFWPELKTLNLQKRLIGIGEVITFLYSLPLTLAGLVWLIAVTDLSIVRQNIGLFLFFGLLIILFRKLSFFTIVEIRSGRYATADSSMDSMVMWVAVLLLGPTALWLVLLWGVIEFAWKWRPGLPVIDHWNRARNLTFFLAGTSLSTLSGLVVYQALGGTLPLSGLSTQTIVAGFAALVVYLLVMVLIWLVYILYAAWVQATLTNKQSVKPVISFMITALGLPNLAHPFALLAAALFVQQGLGAFMFFMVGLILVAFLARRLSWLADSSRQQSRQLEKLEMLGRAIINAPPDASTLPILLQEYVPPMFPSGRIAIWIDPKQPLLKKPEDWNPDLNVIWEWLQEQTETQCFLSFETLPWNRTGDEHNAVLVAPILNTDTHDAIGGVYLELYSLVRSWDKRSLQDLFPVVLSLSAHVASALQQAKVYEQALAFQRVTQELELAGKIQASFFPDEIPRLDGWQLAVTLLPARETSGDFFDFIPLEDGKLGILIADVADKGVGAALYMALSRTLIRTYAIEFDDDPQPDVIFFAANGRILHDARADLFITAFYGILDPETGELTYCNAGHSSPYLYKTGDGGRVEALIPTGMPLGIEEDNYWSRRTVKVEPGDVIVFYTDGIPDSLNPEGEFFTEERLLSAIQSNAGGEAHEIQEMIIEQVEDFVGSAPQFDDITLLVLSREPVQEQVEEGDVIPAQQSE